MTQSQLGERKNKKNYEININKKKKTKKRMGGTWCMQQLGYVAQRQSAKAARWQGSKSTVATANWF